MEATPALDISEEAQDLILDFVRGDSPAAEAQATFHAFCLVSRKWLSSGRRALYYDPLAVRITSCKVAESLLRSVEGNAVLGASVRSLGGLAGASKAVHKMRNEANKVEQGRSGWKWAAQLVAACRNLRSVGVHLVNSKQALAVAERLSPRITSLTLQSPRDMPFSAGDLSHWLDAAKGSLDEVVQLSVLNFHWPRRVANSEEEDGPRFSLPIQSLTLDDCTLDASSLFAFVPSTPSHLRHLSLRTRLALSPADSVILISALGPSLESLSFTSLWADRRSRVILPDEYAELDGHCLPLSFFSPLPNLKKLELGYTTAMSLLKFEALALGSPKLETLNLHRSAYQLDNPPFTLTPAAAFILAKPKLETLFSEQFDALKTLNLGLLPLVKGARWQGLKEIMERKGVKLSMEGCRDPTSWYRCEQCSDLHEL
ncbi:hypothetical protein BCR35DRAFT_353929 [Leucosporidium creatinivorum]|uniref:F-box domain-containing protein n=1 Tax=Leucosporidium creatinivorum TaxID=106004 RepID=A0A1Y2ER85_9BASI|nr:hypothetical protein BCR35DRAFT_353929 [Leucosporidium creatinivorum]